MYRLAVAAAMLTPFAALGAGEGSQPTDEVQSWLGAVVYLIKAAASGGPIALVCVVICFTALLAWLVYLLPKIAQPLASAVSMVRKGSTSREAELERELERKLSEIEGLESRVRVLEHRDEERRRAAAAMIDALETHMAKSGVDTSLLVVLRETMVHDPIVPDAVHMAA